MPFACTLPVAGFWPPIEHLVAECECWTAVGDVVREELQAESCVKKDHLTNKQSPDQKDFIGFFSNGLS